MSENKKQKEVKVKQAIAEKALNKSKTKGEKINPQVEDRRDQHQPRNNP